MSSRRRWASKDTLKSPNTTQSWLEGALPRGAYTPTKQKSESVGRYAECTFNFAFPERNTTLSLKHAIIRAIILHDPTYLPTGLGIWEYRQRPSLHEDAVQRHEFVRTGWKAPNEPRRRLWVAPPHALIDLPEELPWVRNDKQHGHEAIITAGKIQ